MSWYNLPSPSPPTSGHLRALLPPLHSNSEACLCNLCNCIMPTLRLTADQHWTCLDLVPTPTSGNNVWSSLWLRELRKLLEAQGAMRASRAYGEVIVSAIARCH